MPSPRRWKRPPRRYASAWLNLLTPLQRFLQSLFYRRNALLALDSQSLASTPEVLYYQVLPAAPLRAQAIERRPEPQLPGSRPFYQVQVIVEPADAGNVHVTLYCNHREFSELEYAGDLFAAVARHILSQRQGAERYPCYITDLDLSRVLGDGRSQTVHYLRYKAELETALNAALQQA